jgi:vacuolar-type H+-ATPase subunit E/Vma4
MGNSLENLTQYIIEKATSEAESIMGDARVEADALREKERRRLDALHVRQKEQLVMRSEQRIQNAVRQKTASLQRERIQYASQLIDRLFQEAENALCAISAGEFLQFYQHSLEKMCLTGDYIVFLGQRSAQSLSEEECRLLERKTDRYTLSLQKKTIPDRGGFLLGQSSVEYSFLFRDLLNEIRTKESPRLLKYLLG